jgi:toxin ParE1/3/4
MEKFVLLTQAQKHIGEIKNYTVENWGREQAKSYLDGMTAVFRFLGTNPDAGRNCDEDLKPGVMRFIYESHVVYYRKTECGVAVMGILHQNMVPQRHLRI